MIGNNTFILNSATVMEAIQEYLDKRMGENSPKVSGVSMESQPSGTFRVSLIERANDQNN